MSKAVEEWFRIKDAPNAPSKAAFARQKQVKPNTFKKYIHDDPDKRQKLGCHAGCPSLLLEDNSQFVMQHTIQADHANNGLAPAHIIQNMTILQPESSQLQVNTNHYHHTFIKKHANRLKQKPVKAQKLHQSKANVLSPNNSDGSNYMKDSLLPTNKKHRSV
jgi:hypothetical protein